MATASKSKSGDKPVKTGGKPVKPAAKTVAQPKAAKAAKAAKVPAAKKPAVPILTPDQRRYYVEVAAYYIAERRGFHGGSQMDDWVQAESEIDRLVREGILKP